MNRLTYGMSVFIISGALLLSSCSMNLGPETLPSTKPTTESTETETSETSSSVRAEVTDPFSTAVVSGKVVDMNGKLTIKDSNIMNSKGDPIVLKGMSTFGIEECGDFFTTEAVKTLVQDWGCDVIRLAVTGDANKGYLKEPDKYFDPICKFCDMCINEGVYVIVDWNVGYDKSADENKAAAVDFFTRLSLIYADVPNVIYEVSNEDLTVDEENPVKDEWEKAIAPFASDVIKAIRENSPESIIIVGTSDKGRGIEDAAKAKLKFDNIAYGCRVFSGSQSEEQREKIREAVEKNTCVFVTEWGLCSEDCKGGVYFLESDNWLDFFRENHISWCNYAIGSTVNNDANALFLISDKYNSDQKAAHWPEGLISKSGKYAKEKILEGKVDTVPADAAETSDVSDSSETSETA